MKQQHFDLGMIGLGTMGCNLLLNMADHGFAVSGLDTDAKKVQALRDQTQSRDIEATDNVNQFIASLKQPRVVMLLVPAGKPVDAVIEELLPLLSPGDIMIDGGNSHFTDTNRHQAALAEKKIHFLGVGVSGGEEGARRGPSMMPGGPKEAYDHVRPILEACAAKVGTDPCVTYLGPGSAGHYVKMVHNGIEYGLMQLIAESYDLMKRGLGLGDDALHQQFKAWNDAPELNSFLLEITAQIFLQPNGKPDQRLIDLIRDEAKQKGTGSWTSEDAMVLQVPIPTIDTAVMMRDLSVFKPDRQTASQTLQGPSPQFQGDSKAFLTQLQQAFYAAMILTYTQGLALLSKASQQYGYQLKLQDVARIWRGGCIIRSALLEDITVAYQQQPDLSLLMLALGPAQKLAQHHESLRATIAGALQLGIPVPALMSAIGYYDAFRSAWLPANLIQAQRDYFGAHTYERIDQPGTFHTQWGQMQSGKV